MLNKFKRIINSILFLSMLCVSLTIMPLQARADEIASTISIKHIHSGNSSSGGGCYGNRVAGHTHSERGCYPCWNTGSYSESCGCTIYTWSSCGNTRSGCSTHSPNYHGGHSPNCGQAERSTYYTINCGKDTSTQVGTISVTKSKTPTISTSGNVSITRYAWSTSNGSISAGSTTSTITTTKAGTYTCSITYKDTTSNMSSTTSISVTTTMSDYFGIQSVTPSTTSWTNSNVTITVTTQGETAVGYSSNGSTYVSSNVFTVSTNGTYTYYAKATSGTIASKSITISNIDKSVPNISITGTTGGSSYTENTWASKDVVLTVTDSVTHPSSYSVKWYKDGVLISGATSPTYTVSTSSTVNSTYTCVVTTGAGNSDTKTFKVKIDKTVPTTSISGLSKGTSYTTNTWTNDSVVLTGSDSVTHPSGQTIRWYKDGVLISGANSNTLSISNTTSNETVYKFEVTTNANVVGYTEFKVLSDKINPQIIKLYKKTNNYVQEIMIGFSATDR